MNIRVVLWVQTTEPSRVHKGALGAYKTAFGDMTARGTNTLAHYASISGGKTGGRDRLCSRYNQQPTNMPTATINRVSNNERVCKTVLLYGSVLTMYRYIMPAERTCGNTCSYGDVLDLQVALPAIVLRVIRHGLIRRCAKWYPWYTYMTRTRQAQHQHQHWLAAAANQQPTPTSTSPNQRSSTNAHIFHVIKEVMCLSDLYITHFSSGSEIATATHLCPSRSDSKNCLSLLPACLLACLPARLPACLPARLPACLPA